MARCDFTLWEVRVDRTYDAASALAWEPATWGLRVSVKRWCEIDALLDSEGDMNRVW